MKLCSSNHKEIAYEDNTCPLCDILNDVDELNYVIQELEKRVADLENELDEI